MREDEIGFRCHSFSLLSLCFLAFVLRSCYFALLRPCSLSLVCAAVYSLCSIPFLSILPVRCRYFSLFRHFSLFWFPLSLFPFLFSILSVFGFRCRCFPSFPPISLSLVYVVVLHICFVLLSLSLVSAVVVSFPFLHSLCLCFPLSLILFVFSNFSVFGLRCRFLHLLRPLSLSLASVVFSCPWFPLSLFSFVFSILSVFGFRCRCFSSFSSILSVFVFPLSLFPFLLSNFSVSGFTLPFFTFGSSFVSVFGFRCRCFLSFPPFFLSLVFAGVVALPSLHSICLSVRLSLFPILFSIISIFNVSCRCFHYFVHYICLWCPLSFFLLRPFSLSLVSAVFMSLCFVHSLCLWGYRCPCFSSFREFSLSWVSC